VLQVLFLIAWQQAQEEMSLQQVVANLLSMRKWIFHWFLLNTIQFLPLEARVSWH
jgi:hypothetical protein